MLWTVTMHSLCGPLDFPTDIAYQHCDASIIKANRKGTLPKSIKDA